MTATTHSETTLINEKEKASGRKTKEPQYTEENACREAMTTLEAKKTACREAKDAQKAKKASGREMDLHVEFSPETGKTEGHETILPEACAILTGVLREALRKGDSSL